MSLTKARLHAKSRLSQLSARIFDRPVFWPLSQLSTGHLRRSAFTAVVTVVLVSATAGCRGTTPPASQAATTAVPRGGEIVASVRTDPKTFNRHTAADSTTNTIALLMHAKLVRINQATQAVEPMLAESWTTSDNGRRFILALRKDVVFSDGHPFTADDVVFGFQAAYDERSHSFMGEALKAGGKPLTAAAIDPHTVSITFPEPFAPGVRILDNLTILPRHQLEQSLKAGTFAKSWSLDTPPSAMAGLGPFVLREYVPGQRLVFERNPRYFAKAPDGGPLPYLDRLVVEIIPDQNAELLRLESGQLDMMTGAIAPAAYAPMKRAADEGRVKLLDLGVSRSADAFWFNLKPGALGDDPRAAWLQRDELRRAISLAVDRKVVADTVFLGAGVPVYGAETPANKEWYWAGTPQIPYDPGAARRLLASIGLTDRDGDGLLEDAAGRPARFALVTQKGRPNFERAAAVIRDQLKKIGLTVDVVLLDAAAVIERLLTMKYDALYFNLDRSDLDPAISPDFWFSSGSAHVWNLGQKTPATDWERNIDDLMTRQIASPDLAERKRLYDEVQRIFAEHSPILYFVAPRIYVAHSVRVTNVTPAEAPPQLLWRPETVAVRH
jgi:peptide/nickel transport system substrate-binding protein